MPKFDSIIYGKIVHSTQGEMFAPNLDLCKETKKFGPKKFLLLLNFRHFSLHFFIAALLQALRKNISLLSQLYFMRVLNLTLKRLKAGRSDFIESECNFY